MGCLQNGRLGCYNFLFRAFSVIRGLQLPDSDQFCQRSRLEGLAEELCDASSLFVIG